MTVLVQKKRGPKRTREPFSKEAARIGASVEKRRKEKGWTGTHLAHLAGITQQMLSKIEAGQVNPANPKAQSTLGKVAKHLGDSLGLKWLDAIKSIRIEARVAAGQPLEELEGDEMVLVDPNLIKLTGDVCALRVKGDSMVENHILDGDILICRKTPDPRKGSIVVADLKGERGATVKRWERKDDTIFLSADTHLKDSEKQQYPTWALGKVLEVLGLVRRIT